MRCILLSLVVSLCLLLHCTEGFSNRIPLTSTKRFRKSSKISGMFEDSTYKDRFLEFVHVTDPRSLFYNDDEIRQAQKEKEQGINGKFPRGLVESAVNPSNGEIIPKLFRVSAIAPTNIPLVFFMLKCPPSNVPGTLFLHWLNQSYNSACNYANRSGGEQSFQETATAYGLAVSSACLMAYSMGKMVKRAPPAVQRLGVLIPCIAVS